MANNQPDDEVTQRGEGQCSGALDALASCAEAKTCDAEISAYLPAASRSSLIALEAEPAFSVTEFDRYCLEACRSRSRKIDEIAFARDVCGVGAASFVHVVGFLLSGKLELNAAGLPLAEVVAVFGQPTEKRYTPNDCGSAFSEGNIEEHAYPTFTLETDGQRAVIRSLRLIEGNALQLSNGQVLVAMSESQFKQIVGPSAQAMGDSYRVSALASGDFETAYDFRFDSAGKLTQVDFWIAC